MYLANMNMAYYLGGVQSKTIASVKTYEGIPRKVNTARLNENRHIAQLVRLTKNNRKKARYFAIFIQIAISLLNKKLLL